MRPWRHPSETFGEAPHAGNHAATGPGPGGRGPCGRGPGGAGPGGAGPGGEVLGGRSSGGRGPGRHCTGRLVATAAVAASAAAAITLGLLLLVSAAGTTPEADGLLTVTTAAVTPCCTLAAPAAADAVGAVVALRSARTGRTIGCGLVVGGGRGLVATTEQALHGRSAVRVVTATGATVSAWVAARDPTSGLVLLRLSGTVPARTLGVDEPRSSPGPSGDLWAGAKAMTLSMSSGGPPRPQWASGTVVSTDTTGGTRGGSGMAMILLHGASLPSIPGEPLVNPSGGIAGILASSAGSDREFVPISVVVAVSRELEVTGYVRHGWLDVSTATDGSGALIVSVAPGGAASGALKPGDVIVSVDGAPVWSPADLRSRLYVLAPGTRVSLGVLRQGVLVTANLALSSSP